MEWLEAIIKGYRKAARILFYTTLAILGVLVGIFTVLIGML